MVIKLSYTWQDFVLFPKDPDRIRTREARFDLSATKDGAMVITKDFLIRPGDEFEAMRVDELGNVEIWTKDNVWVLQRIHGMEKPIYVRRNPYEERFVR